MDNKTYTHTSHTVFIVFLHNLEINVENKETQMKWIDVWFVIYNIMKSKMSILKVIT